jgi:DNA-binding transcriptional MerR regulator
MNTSTAESTASPAQPAALWHIADVQRETGLAKDTLRVWERRYGFPRPVRDDNGERLYPSEQLQQLKLIKRLLDADHRPGKVVGQPVYALQQLLELPAPKTKGTKLVKGPGLEHSPLDEQWITWLAADETVLIKQALQRSIVRHGLAQVIETTIAPLCQLVGEAWMQGHISIYQEHLFTEIQQSVLRDAITDIDSAGGGNTQNPRVLLTTTPGEQHGLGLLMAECQFALESCERFLLGTSTPVSEMIEAVERLKIDVLALSFSAHATRNDIADSLRQLLVHLPSDVEIWIGGAGALAFSRTIPKEVRILKTAGDIALQVKTWRQRPATHAPALTG